MNTRSINAAMPYSFSTPLIVLSVMALIGDALAQAQSNPEAVSPVKEILYRIELSDVKMEYFIPRARLDPTRNYWNDLLQPFPLDLQKGATAARQHLESIREVSSRLTLRDISIRTKSVIANVKGKAQHADCWYVVFGFSSHTPEGKLVLPQQLTVVMLLDGTIAEETLLSGVLTYPYRSSTATSKLE